jgi:hypothetical protein
MAQKKSFSINYDLYLECLQKFLSPSEFIEFKKQLQDKLKKGELQHGVAKKSEASS